ncbi:MAG: molybdopterin-dependent oxidoreductase [Candidatus Limnocylindrales bacterium]|nr:molybdopterin-dependent oxidoreductase [Candidatus Limnocylindrales bacterium]
MSTTTSPVSGSRSRSLPDRADAWATVAGAAAAAGALSASELLAGILPGGSSLVAAVGQVVIDLQPPGAKDFMVGLFGTNDKLALELFVLAVGVVVGGALGLLARRRFELGTAGFVAFGSIGFLASLGEPVANPAITVVSAVVSVGAGLWILGWLLGSIASAARGTAVGAVSSGRITRMPDWSRRSFLIRAGGVGVGAVAAGVMGRGLIERQRVAPVGSGPAVPPASETVPAILPEGDLSSSIPGLTPIVMPNDRFYRIDTALITPLVDTAGWSLRIHGLVDRETTLTWEELIGLPMFEQYVTISCVSNEVGGQLVGNAKWTGVRLREVLDLAGVQPLATQLVGRSADGWTAGMPTAWVLDAARDPMIALKMNDEALPPAHGYPARLIVPGLYGYVSATKWLQELELTTLESFDGYWVPLGWAKEAPILTQSRIDTPRGGRVGAGRVPVAGIAWAPDRGIARVEVAVDGVWQEARLSSPISDATWVQWVYDWTATPGQHVIQVRATDGTGETQTDLRSRPAPDGARGWDTVSVEVG